jgi:hypothetical protein
MFSRIIFFLILQSAFQQRRCDERRRDVHDDDSRNDCIVYNAENFSETGENETDLAENQAERSTAPFVFNIAMRDIRRGTNLKPSRIAPTRNPTTPTSASVIGQ